MKSDLPSLSASASTTAAASLRSGPLLLFWRSILSLVISALVLALGTAAAVRRASAIMVHIPCRIIPVAEVLTIAAADIIPSAVRVVTAQVAAISIVSFWLWAVAAEIIITPVIAAQIASIVTA